MSYGFDNGRRGGGRGWNDGWGQGPQPPRGWGGPQGGGWGGGPRQPGVGFNGNGRFSFDIGQKVIHIASGIELSVINFGREQLECRKPDLTTGWFYEHELAPLTNETQPPAPPAQQ